MALNFDKKFKVKHQGHNIDIYFLNIDLVFIDTKTIVYDINYQWYHNKCATWCLTLNFKVKGQGHNTDIKCFFIQRHRFSTYEHQTQVSTIYTTGDILNALCHVWPWISWSRINVKIFAYIFLNSPDIDLLLIDIENKFLRYILPKIS